MSSRAQVQKEFVSNPGTLTSVGMWRCWNFSALVSVTKISHAVISPLSSSHLDMETDFHGCFDLFDNDADYLQCLSIIDARRVIFQPFS